MQKINSRHLDYFKAQSMIIYAYKQETFHHFVFSAPKYSKFCSKDQHCGFSNETLYHRFALAGFWLKSCWKHPNLAPLSW